MEGLLDRRSTRHDRSGASGGSKVWTSKRSLYSIQICVLKCASSVCGQKNKNNKESKHSSDSKVSFFFFFPLFLCILWRKAFQLIMPFIWIHAVHSEVDELFVCIHAVVFVRF